MQKRNRRGRFFALFDGPDPNASTPLRDVTTVPTQALFFLNDPFVHAQAAKFAGRIVASSSDDRVRLEFACRQLFGRSATDDEHSDAKEFLSQYAATTTNSAAEKSRIEAWIAYSRVLLSSNELLSID